jgi:hypothetical protein
MIDAIEHHGASQPSVSAPPAGKRKLSPLPPKLFLCLVRSSWSLCLHPPQTTPSASAQTVPTPGCTLQLPPQSVCSAPLFRESSGSTSPRLQIAHR